MAEDRQIGRNNPTEHWWGETVNYTGQLPRGKHHRLLVLMFQQLKKNVCCHSVHIKKENCKVRSSSYLFRHRFWGDYVRVSKENCFCIVEELINVNVICRSKKKTVIVFKLKYKLTEAKKTTIKSCGCKVSWRYNWKPKHGIKTSMALVCWVFVVFAAFSTSKITRGTC